MVLNIYTFTARAECYTELVPCRFLFVYVTIILQVSFVGKVYNLAHIIKAYTLSEWCRYKYVYVYNKVPADTYSVTDIVLCITPLYTCTG